MVSTHSQYISDFNNSSTLTSSEKSPLAMLAKTCETIGLPDTSNRKLLKDEKIKEGHSPNNSSNEPKKDDLSPLSKKKEEPKSPHHRSHSPLLGKKTPVSSEPSTSTASLQPLLMNGRYPMFSSFATGFPPFYPPVMPTFPTLPAFTGAFPTGAPFLRCPDPITCKGCPATMMSRQCVTPGCTSCTLHNPGSSSVDMMMFSPSLFSAYSPLMAAPLPPTSNSSVQIAYQNMMAAASGQTTKHICNWIESNSICGKSFPSADELATHMKCTHATSSTPSNITVDTKSASPRSSTTSVMNHNSLRFHPYMKPNNLLPNAISSPLGLPSFPTLPSFPSPAAFQAMYRQGMMATMPHH